MKIFGKRNIYSIWLKIFEIISNLEVETLGRSRDTGAPDKDHTTSSDTL